MPAARVGDTWSMTNQDRREKAPLADPEPAAARESAGAGEADAEEADRDRLARFLERLHTSQADPAVTAP
jgi:hypothetical protein